MNESSNNSLKSATLKVKESPNRDSKCWWCWNRIIEYVTFECLLTRRKLPNGGSVILMRALFTALLLYLSMLALRNLLDPTRSGEFDGDEMRLQILQSAEWFGGFFAAIYAALYARFSSQWTYLANLYNQIKSVESQESSTDSKKHLSDWKAGFIEDAQELHLAIKPLFASVILVWSKDETVKNAFADHTPGGEVRFEQLVKDVQAAFDRRANEFKTQD